MSRIKCQILEVSPQRIKFALNECDVSLANALRRVIISEIPTMAAHMTYIYENTSVLHDEFLTQRIGLIPFYSQRADDFVLPWKCTCIEENQTECVSCKLPFRLQVHHKETFDANQPQFRDVTSLDIEPVHMIDQNDMQFGRKPVMPVKFKTEDKSKQVGIPIVRLNKGQQINMRFNVQKGNGKMHAKWSPVELATFQPDPDIKINNDIETTLEQKQAIVGSCPTNVYQVHNNALQIVRPDKCIFCGECQKKAESISMQRLKNYIKITKKKDRFIFTVESVGSLPAPTIVKKAMSVLRDKLKSVEQNIDSKA